MQSRIYRGLAIVILGATVLFTRNSHALNAVTNVAGSPSNSSFSGDNGPAVNATLDPLLITHDAAKNLYISDIGNNRIRRIDATTHVITTFAGTGVSGFFGDGGQASSAQFNRPVGLVFDTAGNLYVADQGNHRIRKIDTSGKITTICGNGTGASSADGLATGVTINTPGSMAFDPSGPSGGIVFGELNGFIIRRIDLSTNMTSTIAGTVNTEGYFGDGSLATGSKIGSMSGMRYDSAGNFFFIDAQNQCIRKIDVSTGKISTIAGNNVAAFGGDGGPLLSASFHFYNSGSPAGGMDIDSSGNIFVTDTYNQRIREISGGTVTTICGTGTNGYNGTVDPSTAQISNPEGIDVNAGNLVFCDTGNELVRTIGPAVLSFTSGPTATPSAAGIGQSVSFSVVANLTGTTFSWDFGDGSAAATGGSVTHKYAAAGTFTATVTATNGALTQSGTATVTVTGPLIGSGTNSTGGIYSDSFLAAFGSTPTITNANNPITISGAAITIKLNFAKAQSDSIAVSGTIAVPAAFSVDGAEFTVIVGDFVQTFTLDAKGKAKLGPVLVSIGIKAQKGVVAAQTSKFSIKASKVSLQTALAALGLTNTTVSKVPITLKAQLIFNNELFNISVTGHYTAKQGKTGSTSK